jgi:hypothetical protein
VEVRNDYCNKLRATVLEKVVLANHLNYKTFVRGEPFRR